MYVVHAPGRDDLEAQRTSIRGYRQTGQNRIFCEACHGKLVHSSLVFLFRTARVATVQWFGKNQERITLPSTTSDRQSVRSQTQKSMLIKWRVDWREIESTHYVTIISARNTVDFIFLRKTLFDFIKSCGGRIDLKFSGVALLGLLYSPKWKRSFFSKGKSTFLYGRLLLRAVQESFSVKRNIR